jgi:hypothetical protein
MLDKNIKSIASNMKESILWILQGTQCKVDCTVKIVFLLEDDEFVQERRG